MMLIAAALAPSEARNWPLMLAPPSYVMSPNRLTTPMASTNVSAGVARSASRVRFIRSARDEGRVDSNIEQAGSFVFAQDLQRHEPPCHDGGCPRGQCAPQPGDQPCVRCQGPAQAEVLEPGQEILHR